MKATFFFLFVVAALHLKAQERKTNAIAPCIDIINRLATAPKINKEYFDLDGDIAAFLVKVENLDAAGKDENGFFVRSFYIDAVPICNVHYRNFLLWTRRVFPMDLHATELLVPDTSFWLRQFPNEELGNLLKINYFTDPAFDYYPVVGITWEQAQAYALWRSDRINEATLIHHQLLLANPKQISQNYFSLANYLNHSYDIYDAPKHLTEKTTGAERYISVYDYIFMPYFRLPTAAELHLAENPKNIYANHKQWQIFKNKVLAHNKLHPIPAYYNHKKYELPRSVLETTQTNENQQYSADKNVAEWTQKNYKTSTLFNLNYIAQLDNGTYMPTWWQLAHKLLDPKEIHHFDDQHKPNKQAPYSGFRCVLPNMW